MANEEEVSKISDLFYPTKFSKIQLHKRKILREQMKEYDRLADKLFKGGVYDKRKSQGYYLLARKREKELKTMKPYFHYKKL